MSDTNQTTPPPLAELTKFKPHFIGYVADPEWPHFLWSIAIGAERFEYKTGTGLATKKWNDRTYKHNPRPKDRELVSCNLAQGHGQYDEAWVWVPSAEEVLECLFSDADCARESFFDFCASCGYDTDSIHAFDIYRACAESGEKLRRALGAKYSEIKERVQQ